MKYTIVYFDDQIQNIEVYKTLLQDQYNVIGSTDVQNFEEVLKSCRAHGILIDLHMPMIDGLTLFEKISSSDNYNGCPVFFISGDVSDESRLTSIKYGAVDFFNRQISEQEMVLRLTNKIKMYLQGVPSIELGNLKFDANTFSAQVNGVPCVLTLAEMRILSYLLRSLPNSVSKHEMIESIWGDKLSSGKIHVHLSNMNLKLAEWTHEIKIKNGHFLVTKKSV